MALTNPEATYVKEMILHGRATKAVRKAYPEIKEYCIALAITYMTQNPEVQRHIKAGILYIYRSIIKQRKVIHEPEPLSFKEDQQLLQLVIEGKRPVISEVKGADDMTEIVFALPTPEDVEEAKWLQRSRRVYAENDLAA